MSDLMLHAIIGMPYELAMGGEIARRQFHSRAQSLLAERDQLHAANQRLEGEVARLRDAMLDSANSLEELAFADELELSCQQGVVIRCACKSCMTDRAIKALSYARKLAALSTANGEATK